MPVTGSISSTWLMMSFRTAKGRTLSFTEAPSPRCCQAPPAGQVSEPHACLCTSVISAFWADSLCVCRDAKVCTSVDRIFSIWQERSVYPEELISELKASLQKKEKEKEKKGEIEREGGERGEIERATTFSWSVSELYASSICHCCKDKQSIKITV